jgi:hypothetical protein
MEKDNRISSREETQKLNPESQATEKEQDICPSCHKQMNNQIVESSS